MKNTFAKAAVAVLVLMAPLAADGQTVRYRVVPLPEIGATTNCVPTAINENGDVVGYCDAGQLSSFGVLWRAGVAENLGLWQGSVGTQAWAINSLGQIVGQGDDGDGKEIQALFYNGTAWVEVDGSGGSDQRAYGITDSGVIFGNYTSTGSPGFADWDPVKWIFDTDRGQFERVDLPKPPGTVTGAFINAASRSGWAAGHVTSEAGNSAGLWTNDAAPALVVLVHPLMLGSTAVALGVSDAGHAVGAAISGIFPPVERALLWQNDAQHTAVDIGMLSGHLRSQALAVNDAGVVVGVSYGATGAGRGFVFQNGTLTELSMLLEAGTGEWIINEPAGINNAGQIIASATLNGARQPVILVPTEVAPDPIAVTLTESHTSPQAAGTTITFNAAATGGTGSYEFKWFVSDGTTETTMQEWGAAAAFLWTPTSAGNYIVKVWVRGAGTTADAPEAQATRPFQIDRRVITQLELSANQPSPQVAGTSILLTATASGGTEPYEYKFLLADGTVLREWGGNTFTWTPVTAGNYTLTVWARGAGNTSDAAEKAATLPFVIERRLIATVTLSANQASPQVAGTSILLTATASDGTEPYAYKFLLADGTVLREWGGNTFTWTPVTAGNYTLTVWARGAGNTSDAAEKAATLGFTIFVTDVTVLASHEPPQPAGTTIRFIATATGGMAPYQFKWLISDGVTEKVVQDWSATATFDWTPMVANANYVVSVWVRSAGNTQDVREAGWSLAFPITPATEVPPPHDNRDGLKLLPGKRLGNGAPDYAPRGSN